MAAAPEQLGGGGGAFLVAAVRGAAISQCELGEPSHSPSLVPHRLNLMDPPDLISDDNRGSLREG